MKQIFTLLLSVITTVSLYAYPNFSRMSISSSSGAKLRVMVDNNRYNANDNSVLINNLQQGYHTVKVYRRMRGYRDGNSFGNNNNYQLVYSGTVYVKPLYHVDITINRFGKAFVDEQPISRYSNGDDDGDDWGDDNWNNNNPNDNNWNNNNGYNYGREMNAQSFSTFKQTLEKESFENTKLVIAKQVINNNYFSTAQVKELLALFTFENNKLDIAKYAYRNTLDKGNYFSVADCFTFSNNKDELMRYIQNYR